MRDRKPRERTDDQDSIESTKSGFFFFYLSYSYFLITFAYHLSWHVFCLGRETIKKVSYSSSNKWKSHAGLCCITHTSRSLNSIFKKDKPDLIHLTMWPTTYFFAMFHRWEPCLPLVTNAQPWIKPKVLSHSQIPDVGWAQLAWFNLAQFPWCKCLRSPAVWKDGTGKVSWKSSRSGPFSRKLQEGLNKYRENSGRIKWINMSKCWPRCKVDL